MATICETQGVMSRRQPQAIIPNSTPLYLLPIMSRCHQAKTRFETAVQEKLILNQYCAVLGDLKNVHTLG